MRFATVVRLIPSLESSGRTPRPTTKGSTTMALSLLASLLASAVLAAAAAAAAIALAPAAAADTYGITSIKERPGTVAPPANMPHMPFNGVGPRGTSQGQDAWNDAPKGWTNEAQWARPGASNPFGTFPKPPVFAMD